VSHEEAKTLLSEYRDGELAAPRRRDVDAHLSGCAECRAELAFYGRAAAVLPRPKAPSSFETERFARAVLERLEAPSTSVWSSWRWTAPALALGAAAAAVSLGIVPRGESDPADELLMAQDGGRTLSWLAAPASAADALGVEDR
jgi:anti-sigma factor RsiW